MMVLSNFRHAGDMAVINGVFWDDRNGKYRPIVQIFPPLSAMTAPQSRRYGGILALPHGPPSAMITLHA